jgi:hypothetical protein
MSERYSFCSQYLYCDRCAKIFRKVAWFTVDFSQTNRRFASFGTGRIVAGFAGGLAEWEPKEEMTRLQEALCREVCHPLRFTALYDNDETEIFYVRPRTDGQTSERPEENGRTPRAEEID